MFVHVCVSSLFLLVSSLSLEDKKNGRKGFREGEQLEVMSMNPLLMYLPGHWTWHHNTCSVSTGHIHNLLCSGVSLKSSSLSKPSLRPTTGKNTAIHNNSKLFMKCIYYIFAIIFRLGDHFIPFLYFIIIYYTFN